MAVYYFDTAEKLADFIEDENLSTADIAKITSLGGRWYLFTREGLGGSSGVMDVLADAPLVSSGGTDPTISIPAATNLVDGYMTKEHVQALEAAVTDVGATPPLNSTGGPTPTLSIDAASTTDDGYMAAEDYLKLAGIEDGADVTDYTNVMAAVVTDPIAFLTALFTNAISPATITSNQDDYGPTGYATAALYRLATDASRTIGSLLGGASGRSIIIANVGSNPLVLEHASSTGTAANRILCPGSVSITVQPNSSVLLRYDGSSSRWRVLGVRPTSAAPSTIGFANAEGSSASFALADHVHASVFPPLCFGAESIQATTTTRYLPMGYADEFAVPIVVVSYELPRAGTLKNMRVRFSTPGGNGNDIVFTLFVDNVATALAVTIASTATAAANTSVSVSVSAGSYIHIAVTKAASVGTAPRGVTLTMEFVP